MVVVSTNGRQDTEESIVLGMDFDASDSFCTVGLVLPLWSDTMIHLDGDGGFSVSTVNRVHVFKPVSVQAMWSALQSLHKACDVARCHNYYPGSLFLTWVSYYHSKISSSQLCINEWNAMQDVESHRANSTILFTDLPTERERTERLIKMHLREIMMQKDLENVTSKEIRTELERQMVCNLREFREFIDKEMIIILGQMDSPTEIFEHVYLGSEWNASNLEELQNSGVRYILNVTREIDNFFPGMFEYHNIRVYDEEATNLLEYWNETYKFISKARKAGAKCLVHCKMGVSRSASTVIAYAMKEYGWDLDTAFEYVKEKRTVTKPNPSFMKQLEEYQGILLASKQRHNKLWRSHSDSELSDCPGSKCKPCFLRRSDSNNNSSIPSFHNFLGVGELERRGAVTEDFAKSHTPPDSPTESDSVCNLPGQDDLGDLLPSAVPNHLAVAVVPEENLDNSTGVAVPIALPHPPPSLHILPPTPELKRSDRRQPTELFISVPQHKTVEPCLNVPEKSSSEEILPLNLETTVPATLDQSISDLMSNKHSTLSPASLSQLSPKEKNNNQSELQVCSKWDRYSNADGLFNHSEGSIRSLNAREQTHDRKPSSLQETGVTEAEERRKQENRTSQSEESVDKATPDPTHPSHHHSGVSVHHIVTEIEAICQPSPSITRPSSSLLYTSSDSPHLHAGNKTEVETSKTTNDSLTPQLHPQSSTTLPCDWPAGLVRRVTEQLEQKLKCKMEVAAPLQSPFHTPNTKHTAIRLSPCPLSNEHPPLDSPQDLSEKNITERENTVESCKSKDRKRQTWSHTELQRLDLPGTDPLISNTSQACGAFPNFDSHVESPSLVSPSQSRNSTKDTSTQCQLVQPQPHTCSHPVTLDVVKGQQSETDEESSSQGGQGACDPGCDGHSWMDCDSRRLERIEETLRELQAFLYKGVERQEGKVRNVKDTNRRKSLEQTPTTLHVGQGLREQEERSCLEQPKRHKGVRLESRIRQAGLTTPSLMKRSASLAKLGCLELSTNDLCDLDLKPHTETTSLHSQDSSHIPPPHADDTWKKQKVLAQNTCVGKTVLSLREKDLEESSFSPSPCLPHITHQKGDADMKGEQESTGRGSVTTSCQQGRGHSRRSRKASAEKKQRAITVLYNTM
ncbi:protein phosphatase Slingshot homolog 2-like%2C partial [Xyrichtys novacula]|nr:protein phosphatase Slingshot homolog 2-like%2C partial [Xyrichtys novacula]